MQLNHFLGLIAGWLMATLPVQAQPLAELIQLAGENNLELKALDLESKAAFEIAAQSRQLPGLDIELGGFLAPVETRLGAQRLRLSAAQSFPWFGTLKAKEAAAHARARPILEKTNQQRLELYLKIKSAYFQLYQTEETQKIVERNIRFLEALRTLALSKIESGQGSTADVLRANLRIQELEQELVILENRKLIPTTELNQLLNREPGLPFSIDEELNFAPIPFNKASLTARIDEEHPLSKALTMQQDAARRQIDLNRFLAKPQLKVGVDYIEVNPRNDALPPNNGRDILQLRAGLKVPLSSNAYKARDREETFRIDALEQRRRYAISSLKAEIEKAFIDYETTVLHYQLYRKQVATTDAAIQVLESSYSIDGNDFDELLRLEMDLVDYDIKLLQAIVESHLVKARLEKFVY